MMELAELDEEEDGTDEIWNQLVEKDGKDDLDQIDFLVKRTRAVLFFGQRHPQNQNPLMMELAELDDEEDQRNEIWNQAAEKDGKNEGQRHPQKEIPDWMFWMTRVDLNVLEDFAELSALVVLDELD